MTKTEETERTLTCLRIIRCSFQNGKENANQGADDGNRAETWDKKRREQ